MKSLNIADCKISLQLSQQIITGSWFSSATDDALMQGSPLAGSGTE